MKMSTHTLVLMAKAILHEDEPDQTYNHLTMEGGKLILSRITERWVQTFMEKHDVVPRQQCGKLQVNPIKEKYLKRTVGFIC